MRTLLAWLFLTREDRDGMGVGLFLGFIAGAVLTIVALNVASRL